MKCFVFVDPGLAGGIAVALGSMDDLSTHNLDGIDTLQDILRDYECYDRRVICEQVPPYVGQAIPGSAAFKLGRSFGLIEGLALGMNLPCEMVSPKVWQKGLPGLKGLTGAKRKRALKSIAQRLYPNAKVTLRNADAILIGHHFLHNR